MSNGEYLELLKDPTIFFTITKQRNRTAMKTFFELTKKKEAQKELPSIESMIDKLARNNIIHDNKASNLKANLTKHLAGLK